jgi:16S rRNA (uracil1498-N3)-methyltransferase
MHLFYSPDIQDNGNYLNEEETYHCIKVLRHKINDLIYVLDGKGRYFECKITDTSQKQCKVFIQKEIISSFPEPKCHIAVAPTKNIERIEWFIEKSCETGIKEITPIICKHSERKVIKPERFEKIIISAMKQASSFWHPKLNALISFEKFILETQTFTGQKFIACCTDEKDKKHLKEVYQKNNEVIIMIGPEGDFDEEEVNQAIATGFNVVSLGNNRLRTETAALIACHTVQIINE